MKTSKSFNQEYIEKAKTLIHEILEDKKEYDDWTQICFSMQNAVQAAANIWGISSDEQINKMRAFITEMVLIELSNLKQFDIVFKKKGIRSLDTLYCPKCGSNNVEERAWVNPNTDEISYNDSVEEEDCWCGICEEHVELCTLSELWEMFGDIPVNNDDEIEEDFLNFPVGTSKIDVWHWFDERCPNNLHDDLMYPKNDEEELYDPPIILVNLNDGPMDVVIHKVWLNDGCIELSAFDNEWGNQVDIELEDIVPGHLAYLIEYMPITDKVKSVAINND